MNKLGVYFFSKLITQFAVTIILLIILLNTTLLGPYRKNSIIAIDQDINLIKNSIELAYSKNLSNFKLLLSTFSSHNHDEAFFERNDALDHTEILNFIVLDENHEVIFSLEERDLLKGVNLMNRYNCNELDDSIHMQIVNSNYGVSEFIFTSQVDEYFYIAEFAFNINEIVKYNRIVQNELDYIIHDGNNLIISNTDSLILEPYTVKKYLTAYKDVVSSEVRKVIVGRRTAIDLESRIDEIGWIISMRMPIEVFNRVYFNFFTLLSVTFFIQFFVSMKTIYDLNKKVVDPIVALADSFIDENASKEIVTHDELTVHEVKLLYDNFSSLSEELSAKEKDLNEFVYIASHDLQEPLRVISSYVRILETDYADQFDEQADKFFEYIIDGTKRMKALLVALLNYSKTTEKALVKEKVNLDDLILQVLEDLIVTIMEKEVAIQTDPLGTIECDAMSMKQLFQNIISNAIKFNTKQPEIHVMRDHHKLIIKDNGIGIDEKYLADILIPFSKLHNNQIYKGTGIGLAVVKKVVDRHNWSLEVDSKVGEGTSFIINMEGD